MFWSFEVNELILDCFEYIVLLQDLFDAVFPKDIFSDYFEGVSSVVFIITADGETQ